MHEDIWARINRVAERDNQLRERTTAIHTQVRSIALRSSSPPLYEYTDGSDPIKEQYIGRRTIWRDVRPKRGKQLFAAEYTTHTVAPPAEPGEEATTDPESHPNREYEPGRKDPQMTSMDFDMPLKPDEENALHVCVTTIYEPATGYRDWRFEIWDRDSNGQYGYSLAPDDMFEAYLDQAEYLLSQFPEEDIAE